MTQPMTDDPDEGLSELHNVRVPRVDAVKGPATGIPFLILKSRTDQPFWKAKYNADDLKRMAGNGQAMKDESYPIADKDDLDRAIHAVGRGSGGHDAIRRHIISRARSLGASSEIPDNWAADGSIKKASNAMDPEVLDENLSDAVDDATDTAVNGDGTDAESMAATSEPGSAEWEALDAAKARSAVTALTALRTLVESLAAREDAEAFAGEGDGDACDLMEACSAIDCALGIMAKFAVDEQAEADTADDIAKSQDDYTERLRKALFTKAGRVLSAANESALQSASDSIMQVLSQLKAAPMAAEGGEPVKVAKADGDDAGAPVLPTALVDLLAQLAVAYQTWHDSGAVPSGVADTAGDAPADTDTAPPAEQAPTDAEPPAPVEDAMTPQPPAPAAPAAPQTPAAPAAAPSDDDAQTAVAKSITDALEAKYGEVIAALEKRLSVVEATPVDDGPMLAGKPLPSGVVPRNGQDTAPGDDRLSELRKELEAERNPVRRAELQSQLANEAWKQAATGNAPRI